MTSGNFTSIELDQIHVNRAERQRRDLPNITILADSINRLGLIHPIVIDRNNILIAGERRLEAVRSLGWTSINCQYFDELDPTVARAVELEENVKREALPWQDECRAVLEYHEIRRNEDPEWSMESTGAALGISQPSVVQKIAVAREIESGNTMVAEAPRYSTARGIVARAESRKDEEALLAIPRRSPGSAAAPLPEPVLNADFNVWAPSYTGPKFNFIHCDFPYGINADKFNQGAAAAHGGYSDTEDDYWKLLQTLAVNLNLLLSESCHIMFWFSMHYYQDTLNFFEKNTDFHIDPFPLIWIKSDNVGILPDPERGPRRIYETCLFGARGDRKIVRATSNGWAAHSQRDLHMSIKPADMLEKFFRMFVDNSTLMLDPTCGSGSSLQAASRLNARLVLGLETNSEFADRANTEFLKTIPLKIENAE